MAKSIGRVGILRDGTRVTVLEVIRVLSKNPKIVVTSWLDCSGSGADVYRLVDGRVLLAEFVELTDETVEFTPRKKTVSEPEVDSDCTDTETESEEPCQELRVGQTFVTIYEENTPESGPLDGEEVETEILVEENDAE